ncbi:hypothetical protein LPTSP4_05410 [Leptospira ryugenii]|uniref:Uncharacterized protein n=1 Tax=Leptospira ryugenii TaxID=1917863 RepID=A0A2P2DWN8_9LEPT|nr:hypothetical protein [Leptospira ryugenii]GBF49032.1 hypothetical protein LPTSP4_05410 [Leptospira ryugenii]
MKPILILLLLTTHFLYAQSSGSLAEEFAKLDAHVKNPKKSADEKKKTLETNLLNSLRSSLTHRLTNPKKELKDLKIQDLVSERQPGTNNFFVKYKNYLIAYQFASDPEENLVNPSEEYLLERSPGDDLSANHDDKK